MVFLLLFSQFSVFLFTLHPCDAPVVEKIDETQRCTIAKVPLLLRLLPPEWRPWTARFSGHTAKMPLANR
jgi:hypothetical protein